jgi:hypothetical protein
MLLPLLFSLLPLTSASPKPAPIASDNVQAVEQPHITPSPASWEATKTYKYRRGVISDVTGAIDSVLSDLGNVPSYVASGVPNFFQGFPTGANVKSKLGLSDKEIEALPTQVLNIP